MKQVWNKHRNAVIIGGAAVILAVLVLILALTSGGKQTEEAAAVTPAVTETTPETASPETEPAETLLETEAPAETTMPVETEPVETEAAETAAAETAQPEQTEAEQPAAETSAPAAEAAAPEQQQTQQTSPEPAPAAQCTISISCATVLNNWGALASEKQGIIPSGGTILSASSVQIQDGDTVFSVLQRITRDKGILMEYTSSGIKDGAYIEGIGGLYEFDCGELSGWMYRVNGTFPNVSCDQYPVSSGDTIEWVYTCDLGNDVS